MIVSSYEQPQFPFFEKGSPKGRVVETVCTPSLQPPRRGKSSVAKGKRSATPGMKKRQETRSKDEKFCVSA